MDINSEDRAGTPNCYGEKYLETKLWNKISSMEDSGYSTASCDSVQRQSLGSYRIRFDTFQSPERWYHQTIISELSTVSSKRLNGQQYVDLIPKLAHYPHVLRKVFSHLDPDDLVRCCLVSKSWKKACETDSRSCKRRKEYLSRMGLRNKENMGQPDDVKQSNKRSTRLYTSTPLSSITSSHQINFCLTPVASLPNMPALALALPTRDRFSVYLEEAEKLDPGKYQMPCPRCSLPSRIDKDINLGQCSQAHCRFQFCLVCLGEQHIRTVCPAAKSNSEYIKWPRSLVSRSSRRKLRRL